MKPVVTMIPADQVDPESAAGKAKAFLTELTQMMGVNVEIAVGTGEQIGAAGLFGIHTDMACKLCDIEERVAECFETVFLACVLYILADAITDLIRCACVLAHFGCLLANLLRTH